MYASVVMQEKPVPSFAQRYFALIGCDKAGTLPDWPAQIGLVPYVATKPKERTKNVLTQATAAFTNISPRHQDVTARNTAPIHL